MLFFPLAIRSAIQTLILAFVGAQYIKIDPNTKLLAEGGTVF